MVRGSIPRQPQVECVAQCLFQDTPPKRNWLDCIRSRQLSNADIELGHLGSIPGQLANITYRVNRRIKWDGERETIPNDSEAATVLGQIYRDPYTLPKV